MIFVLIILVFLLWKIFSSSYDTETVSPQNTNHIPKGNNLQYLTNHPNEQGLSSAKILDNIVYCCSSHAGEFKIGSYEINADGKYDVWNKDHSIKIGYVDPNEKEVFLSPKNVWVNYKIHNPNSRAVPEKFVMLAVHWRWGNNDLYDEETRQVVAKLTGDPIAAGAAFICLTYETLMYNKYYYAFHGWM